MRLAAILVGVLVVAAPAWADAPSQQELEEALTCQCGCGLTVHSCNHLQCPSAEPMKDEIRGRIAAGESADTILAAFAAKYGEKVLSAPTMRGFNWFAWITPFAAVFLAGAFLVVLVRRRVGQAQALEPPVPPGGGMSDELRARLARELEEIDRE